MPPIMQWFNECLLPWNRDAWSNDGYRSIAVHAVSIPSAPWHYDMTTMLHGMLYEHYGEAREAKCIVFPEILVFCLLHRLEIDDPIRSTICYDVAQSWSRHAHLLWIYGLLSCSCLCLVPNFGTWAILQPIWAPKQVLHDPCLPSAPVLQRIWVRPALVLQNIWVQDCKAGKLIISISIQLTNGECIPTKR